MLGKLLPQAIDLEETVIGAILLESNSEVVRQLKNIILPEHFYKEAHQEIITAIIDLDKASVSADMRSIVMQLRKTGRLEMVGGAYAIAELTSKVSSSSNLEYYYRCLIELWMKRELIALANNINSLAYEDTSDVFAILESVYSNLKKIDPNTETD